MIHQQENDTVLIHKLLLLQLLMYLWCQMRKTPLFAYRFGHIYLAIIGKLVTEVSGTGGVVNNVILLYLTSLLHSYINYGNIFKMLLNYLNRL